jgi:hypothetical protein
MGTLPNKIKILFGSPTFAVHRLSPMGFTHGRWCPGFSGRILRVTTHMGEIYADLCGWENQTLNEWELEEDGSIAISFVVSIEIAKAFQSGSIGPCQAWAKMNPEYKDYIQANVDIWDELVLDAQWNALADEDDLYAD